MAENVSEQDRNPDGFDEHETGAQQERYPGQREQQRAVEQQGGSGRVEGRDTPPSRRGDSDDPKSPWMGGG